MTAELDHYNQIQVDKIIEEKTKTDAVIFSIADGIIMTDRDGRLLLANKQAEGILGLPSGTWQGLPLWQFITDPVMNKAFTELLGNPEENIEKEIELAARAVNAQWSMIAGNLVSWPLVIAAPDADVYVVGGVSGSITFPPSAAQPRGH